MNWIRGSSLALILAGSPCLQSQEDDPLLEAFQKLMNPPVRSVTKFDQSASDSPAIVSVIERSALLTSGVTSVAEALRMVPGLYGIDDHLAHNFGVRGVSGGLRSYNRILKVMIDDQPVSFRPDSTAYLGPELIPLEAVERIEIIRGPASAVYGANAFLGVINIITRRPDSGLRGTLVGRAVQSSGRLGSGGEALAAKRWDKASLLAAAAHFEIDRSGLELPSSSPILRVTPPKDPVSRQDWSRPGAFFLKALLEPSQDLALEWTSHFSRLNTRAEWVDFGTLSHANKVVQELWYSRLKGTWTPKTGSEFVVSLAEAHGRPGSEERLSSGSATSYPRRKLNSRESSGTLEGRFTLGDATLLTVGTDYTQDREQLQEIYTVNKLTGIEQRTSLAQEKKTFTNRGLYAQYVTHPTADLGLTANLRHDRHNTYGGSTNYRLGVVYRFAPEAHLKLLYGTSFKAPSPVQLHAQPLYAGELLGNPDLLPELARTLEAQAGWAPRTNLSVALNLFDTHISNKIDLRPSGTNLKPVNQGEIAVRGAELEAHLFVGAHRFYGFGAYQKASEISRNPFLGDLSEPTAKYPRWSSGLRWQAVSSTRGTLQLELHSASARRSASSGTFVNYFTPYQVGSYILLDAAWSRQWRALRFNLRLDNLLDRKVAEPGDRGYDLPAGGRRGVLTVGWTF